MKLPNAPAKKIVRFTTNKLNFESANNFHAIKIAIQATKNNKIIVITKKTERIENNNFI